MFEARSSRERHAELTRAGDQLGQISWFLDDMFRIPGLNWRFGLDSLIGLVPGVGDLVSASLGLMIIFRSLQFQIPGVVIGRMVVNSLIDLLLGAIPFLGDLFDFAWKSNAMNMRLFQQYAKDPLQSTNRHWIAIGLIALLFGGVFLLVSYCAYYLLKSIALAR